MQGFLTIRKCLEAFFKPKMMFARFGCPAHTGKAMVFRGHRPIVGCIDHGVLPRVFLSDRQVPERRTWNAQTGPIT